MCPSRSNSRYDRLAQNQSHPKLKSALAAVKNTKNRQAKNDLQTKEATKSVKTIKSVKAVTGVRDAWGDETRSSLGINYEKAAAEAINKVKQDLATRENEQRLKQEIEG